eukprot:SAG11_NODE_2221_length_3669_cov_7.764986_4_plen_143_part_00
MGGPNGVERGYAITSPIGTDGAASLGFSNSPLDCYYVVATFVQACAAGTVTVETYVLQLRVQVLVVGPLKPKFAVHWTNFQEQRVQNKGNISDYGCAGNTITNTVNGPWNQGDAILRTGTRGDFNGNMLSGWEVRYNGVSPK